MKTIKIPNIKLIMKMAWSFNHTTGIEFEELRSEAILAYYEAMQSCTEVEVMDGGQKILNPFIYRCMQNALVNYCKKQNKMLSYSNFPEAVHPEYQPKVFENESSYDFTGRAKELVNMILENNAIDDQLPPKKIRGQIVDELRNIGWSWSVIWDTLREVKLIVNSN